MSLLANFDSSLDVDLFSFNCVGCLLGFLLDIFLVGGVTFKIGA